MFLVKYSDDSHHYTGPMFRCLRKSEQSKELSKNFKAAMFYAKVSYFSVVDSFNYHKSLQFERQPYVLLLRVIDSPFVQMYALVVLLVLLCKCPTVPTSSCVDNVALPNQQPVRLANFTTQYAANVLPMLHRIVIIQVGFVTLHFSLLSNFKSHQLLQNSLKILGLKVATQLLILSTKGLFLRLLHLAML